ncbi:FUSC family protein [Streptomyces sp. NPDC004286]|uniref:FUSC family protein n=1 Tax=Streptomyces sp. NPDC004286 TaxID=3364696 RepID=UPI00368155EA
MSHKSSADLAPPDWLVRNLRPQAAPPVNRAAAARAAIAMALPLAIGLAAGHVAYGALAAIGAMNGIISDTADAYRLRIVHIAVPQFVGAVGIVLGTLVYGRGWYAVVMVVVVALVSGMVSTIGAVASVSALLLLLYCIIGAGLPLPAPWWLPPALMTGGGLLVLLLTLLAWPLRAGRPERASVARAYRAVADLLAACGDPDRYVGLRFDVTQALYKTYDLLVSHRVRHHGQTRELTRLLAQLNALTTIVDAAPVAHYAAQPMPPEVPETIRRLADAIETGRAGPLDVPTLPPAATSQARAVEHAVRHAAEVISTPDIDPSPVDDRLGVQATLRSRAARAVRNVVLCTCSWRYGLRLAICVALAQILVSVIEVPRSYWVALTVAFVLKPDFGSVFSRALLRALGTVVGLVLAAAVLTEVPIGWWDVLVMAVLAPLIPIVTPRGYGYQTAVITPMVLLLIDILTHQGTALVLPRFLDSLMGCAIALIAGYLLWPETWHTRVGHRLATAVANTAMYVDTAFAPGTDPVTRARARHRLYRDLSHIRTEFQRALTEPPPMGRRAAAWWPVVVAVERIVDATTAARVRVCHGAAPPPQAEIRQLSAQLRTLADRVRAAESVNAAPSDLPELGPGLLEPLRQEVATATTIMAPR